MTTHAAGGRSLTSRAVVLTLALCAGVCHVAGGNAAGQMPPEYGTLVWGNPLALSVENTNGRSTNTSDDTPPPGTLSTITSYLVISSAGGITINAAQYVGGFGSQPPTYGSVTSFHVWQATSSQTLDQAFLASPRAGNVAGFNGVPGGLSVSVLDDTWGANEVGNPRGLYRMTFPDVFLPQGQYRYSIYNTAEDRWGTADPTPGILTGTGLAITGLGSIVVRPQQAGRSGAEAITLHYVAPPLPPCLADLAGGTAPTGPAPDGTIDGTDFIAFINSFAIGDTAVDPLADVAGSGSDGLDPDGTIDGSDFIAFINAFAAGC
jgi:hypothetical protein